MLPLHVVLGRHGESEGNVLNKQFRQGDYSGFTPALLRRRSASFHLTEKGKTQALVAGEWLKQNNLTRFDRHYVSTDVRAMETASLFDLPDAQWEPGRQLRERDSRIEGYLPDDEWRERFASYLRLLENHRFDTVMPGGESTADVCERLRNNIINTLYHEGGIGRVIIVSHHDVMQAFRVIFEHLSADQYDNIVREGLPESKIGNCQIMHYTRVDPDDPNHILPHLGWVRSVNPWDPKYAGHDWRLIERHRYSNAELMALAERYSRLVND